MVTGDHPQEAANHHFVSPLIKLMNPIIRGSFRFTSFTSFWKEAWKVVFYSGNDGNLMVSPDFECL